MDLNMTSLIDLPACLPAKIVLRRRGPGDAVGRSRIAQVHGIRQSEAGVDGRNREKRNCYRGRSRGANG